MNALLSIIILGCGFGISSHGAYFDHKDEERANQCPICMDDFDEEYNIRCVTDCCHEFCQNCLATLRSLKSNDELPCPLCRKPIINIEISALKNEDTQEQISLPNEFSLLELLFPSGAEWTIHGYQ